MTYGRAIVPVRDLGGFTLDDDSFRLASQGVGLLWTLDACSAI